MQSNAFARIRIKPASMCCKTIFQKIFNLIKAGSNPIGDAIFLSFSVGLSSKRNVSECIWMHRMCCKYVLQTGGDGNLIYFIFEHKKGRAAGELEKACRPGRRARIQTGGRTRDLPKSCYWSRFAAGRSCPRQVFSPLADQARPAMKRGVREKRAGRPLLDLIVS